MSNDSIAMTVQRLHDLRDEMDWLQAQLPSEGVSLRILAIARNIETLENARPDTAEKRGGYEKDMARTYQDTAGERGVKLSRIEAICEAYLSGHPNDGLNARSALQSIATVLKGS